MNLFDLGVLIVVGLSALLSFFRGFVREVLSLGAWLGASVITLYTFPMASKYIEPQVKSEVIASGLASIGVFFIALILLSILTSLILKFVKTGSEVGVLDNIIGLCFGVARGVLIVSIAYFVMTIVLVEKDYPDWVRTSESRPYIAKSAKWVAKLTPSYLDAVTGKKEDKESTDGEKVSANPFERGTIVKRITPPNTKDEDMPTSKLPSIEDLQKRIREENEKR
ncbi:MAG: CvpA family protein [Rickettsiales bacterium]